MQNVAIPTARGNLSGELAASIRERVLSGALKAGERINEVHLSQALGVSRTPLREALTLLIGERFLSNVPRRGYFVRALSADEVEHLYVIRNLLDPEALRLAGIPSEKQLRGLGRLNRSIARARKTDPAKIITMDDAWHRLLLSHCPNPLLIEMIEQHMLRTRRYEHAYMRECRHVEIAVDEHDRIIRALRRGDLRAACAALRRNMDSAREPLMAWLREQAAKEKA